MRMMSQPLDSSPNPLNTPTPMTLADLRALYDLPLFDLISRARAVYLEHWQGGEMQLCTLLSIKTGGCSEDCGYCAQSARYQTGVKAEKLMETDAVLAAARALRCSYCMLAHGAILRRDFYSADQLVEIAQDPADSDLSPAEATMMAFVDKLTRDEILDLIAYLVSRGDKTHAAFGADGHEHKH